MANIKYTDEYIKQEALKYKTRSEFKCKDELLYNTAWNRDLLNEVCSHMEYKHTKWNFQKLQEEALKYKTRSEFSIKDGKAYTAARRKNYLNTICTHMEDGRKNRNNKNIIYTNRRTILYYIIIEGKHKIGVALHEKYKDPVDTITKYRYNPYNNIEIIDYVIFNNGIYAIETEQLILDKFKKYRYMGENFILRSKKSGGEGECFTIDIYNDIKSYFINK